MAVFEEYVVSFAARAVRAFAGVAGDRSGATAVEYGIIAAGIAVTIIGALSLVGGEVSTLFDTISTSIDNAISP
jgi:pilus assembly protein Flp/PilA